MEPDRDRGEDMSEYGGFARTRGDEAVGIFGEDWWHDDCPNVPLDGAVPDAIKEMVSCRSIGSGMNHVLACSYVLTCPACDAQWAWIENECDPIYTQE